MVRALCTGTLFMACSLFAQNCSTYAVVDPFDGKTSHGIDGLKAENFEAKAGSLSLPIVSATQNFNSRVLILLQIGTSPEQQRM